MDTSGSAAIGLLKPGSSAELLEARLAMVEAALVDADASLLIDIGGHHEATSVRLWQGSVLVDWEPDMHAGGCLLRPFLLRRLLALHAQISAIQDGVRIIAPGRVVAGLSAAHTDLVDRLGGVRRIQLEVDLRFAGEKYRGGRETYFLAEHGRRVPLLRVTAEVRLRRARAASRRRSPARM